MNRLREKLIEAVRLQKDTFYIKSASDARLYAHGFLSGVLTQQKYHFSPLSLADGRELLQEACRVMLVPFYFTFGSDEKYPYPNGCVVVYAENLGKACKKFKEKFPHPYDKGVLNCAFYYEQKDWECMEKKPPISEEIFVI